MAVVFAAFGPAGGRRCGVAMAEWAPSLPIVKTVRVRIPESAAASNDLVALNATGYVIAAHKIELASKVVGRVAWVGVEMGDKIEKDWQILVRLEDDEYKRAGCPAEKS